MAALEAAIQPPRVGAANNCVAHLWAAFGIIQPADAGFAGWQGQSPAMVKDKNQRVHPRGGDSGWRLSPATAR